MWKHENGVAEESHFNVMHEALSEIIELMSCVDQLDVSNLTGAEVCARHLQFVEHEQKKKSDAKRTPDGSEYFLGRTRRTGGALINPELLRWVAEKRRATPPS